MRKYNRILLPLWALVACESLEGERRLVPAANISIFIPANWETTSTEGQALELQPRGVKSVKVRIAVDKAAASLDDTVKQEMTDAAALEKKEGVKLVDVTRIAIKRGTLAGTRLVFQLQLNQATQQPKNQVEVTQIEDIYRVEEVGVGVIAQGPKADVDRVAAEVDRILSSVRQLTPEPEAERVYPPDAVTSASQRATQKALSR